MKPQTLSEQCVDSARLSRCQHKPSACRNQTNKQSRVFVTDCCLLSRAVIKVDLTHFVEAGIKLIVQKLHSNEVMINV